MANAWQHFTARQISTASSCPIEAVQQHFPKIVEQLQHAGINERPVQVGVIGTVAIESASTFMPVREAFFLGEPAAEEHRKTLAYYPYYGRGQLQLTHENGYRAMGPKIAALWGTDPSQPDFDLVSEPDRALDPDFAAAIVAIYFRDTKTLQGYSLVDACREGDWAWVRRLVYGGPDLKGTARIQTIATALAVSPPVVGFNPDTPTELQRQDWTCSIRSVMWMLKSMGVSVTPEAAQDAMSPQYVTPQLGLLAASGGGIVAVLRDFWGVGSVNDAAASFDEVAAVAGRQPVAIGLRNWGGPGLGHWSAVRRLDGDRLVLANPAGTGGQFGQQTLTRAEYDQRGPGSMVTIPVGAPPVVPAPPGPTIDRAAVAAQVQKIAAMHDAYDQAMRSELTTLALMIGAET
jgi:hypothetical protein